MLGFGGGGMKEFLVKVIFGLDNKEFVNQLQATGRKMQSLGSGMNRAITLPLLAAAGASVKFSTDFESTMSKVIGLVGASKEQVGAWRKEILAMAPAVGKTANELGDALYFITSAGIKGKTAMEILDASAKAAASGLGDTAVVANVVSSAINAYGAANLSSSSAVDILVAAVREGKAEADEFAGALGKVLPIASNMGIRFDEVAAATAALTRTGSDAYEATTQLRQIMVSLLSPTNEAEKELKRLGTSSQELRDIISEQGLLSGLKKIRDTLGDNAESSAIVFGNVRALTGIMDLFGKNAEQNIGVFKSLENATGSLNVAFEAVSETAGFKFKQSMVALQVSAIQIGDALAPIFVKISQAVGNLATWFSALDPAAQQNIITIAGVVAALGPFITILGKILVIAPAVKGAVLFMFGPWGLVVAAVVAGVALIIMNWDKISDAAQVVKTEILKWMQPITDWFTENSVLISETWQKMLDQLSVITKYSNPVLSAVWKDLWDNIKTVASIIWETIKTIFEIFFHGLGGTLKTYMLIMKGDWKGAWEEIKTTFTKIWTDMEEWFGKMLDKIWGRLTGWFDNVKSGFKNLWSELVGHSIIPDIVNGIISEFERMVSTTTTTIVNWIQSIKDNIMNFGRSMLGGGGGASSGTESGTSEDTSKPVNEKIETVWDEFGKKMIDEASQLGKSIASGKIKNVIQNIFGILGDALAQQVSSMISKSIGGGGIFGNIMGAFGGGLISGAIGLLGNLFGGGGGSRGATPEKPNYVYITNWKDFFEFGASIPYSAIESGRMDKYNLDYQGRTVLDYALTGYQNQEHALP